MSGKVSWSLFILLFATCFTLFQFEADSRRQRAALDQKIQELELRLSTYIRSQENDSTKQNLNQVNASQQHLLDRMNEDKKRVMELLELLITKDEKFARDLTQLKEALDNVKLRAGILPEE